MLTKNNSDHEFRNPAAIFCPMAELIDFYINYI